jgi:hypothetical protein
MHPDDMDFMAGVLLITGTIAFAVCIVGAVCYALAWLL